MAVGVVRLAPLGLASPAANVHRRAMGSAAASLGQMVRAEDRLWEHGEHLAVSIGSVGTAPMARRVGQRLASVVSDAVRSIAPLEVVIAVAWGPSGVAPETLERRAAAAAEAGVDGPGVVVVRDRGDKRATGSGRAGVIRSEPHGSRPASVAGVARRSAFVGRAAALEVLREAWADVLAGTPRLVGVEGEAGIGKTALLRAVVAEVDPASVLWVAGDDDERTLAFGLVGRLATGAGAPGLSTTLRDWAASLGPGSDPLLVGAGLLSVLTAGSDPLLVVIDDGHLADSPSLAAFRFVARRLLRDRVLMVLAFRPEERSALGSGWEALLAEPGSATVRLEGLAPDELMALAAALGTGPLSPAGAARLFEHTGGHPLYARMLLDQLPTVILEQTGNVLPAPASLAQAIVGRLGSCAPATRELLAAIAVMGMGCDLALLAKLDGTAEPEAAAGEAARAGLLVREPGPDGVRVAFSHPLVRAAIYHDIDPVERRRLHARAGGLLAGGSGLAHRVAAAEGPDGGLADELERAAHADAGQGRLHQAALGLWRAFELTPAGPQRFRRLLTAVEARVSVGGVAIAERAEQELSALVPDPWVDYVVGFLAWGCGRFPDAAARLERAWTGLEAGSRPEGAPADLAGRVATVLAMIATLRVDHAEMIRWSANMAARVSAPALTALAEMVWALGTAIGPGGDPSAVLAGTPALANPADLVLLMTRGVLRWWADDLPGAYGDLVSVVERAARGEELAWPSFALGALGATAYRLGRLEEAVLYGELAVATASEAGRGSALAVLHAWACYPHAARGEWEPAESHAAAAAEWAARTGMAPPQVAPAAAAAAIADARGDTDAFAAAATAIEAVGGSPYCNVDGFGPALADALARTGRHVDADAALDRYEQAAAPLGDRPFAAMTAARVRGRLTAAGGDWETAATLFHAAVELAGGLAMPLEAAKAHLAAGQAALQSHLPSRAAHHLYAALDAFDTLGADAYAAQAVAAIDSAGLARRRRDSLARLLTPAEGAVARLVAAGLSNKEVAARLFVSPNAVAWHLTHIYAKLGISSRRALAGQIAPTTREGHTQAD